MTRKDAINKWVIPAIKNTWNEKKCSEIIKTLSAEPCEDCISRTEAIKALDCEISGSIESDIDLSEYKREFQEFADMIINAQEKAIQALPPVTPKPKIGHWIKNSQYSNDYCSECHYELLMIRQTKYCPNCGADMKGEENGQPR